MNEVRWEPATHSEMRCRPGLTRFEGITFPEKHPLVLKTRGARAKGPGRTVRRGRLRIPDIYGYLYVFVGSLGSFHRARDVRIFGFSSSLKSPCRILADGTNSRPADGRVDLIPQSGY